MSRGCPEGMGINEDIRGRPENMMFQRMSQGIHRDVLPISILPKGSCYRAIVIQLGASVCICLLARVAFCLALLLGRQHVDCCITISLV